MSRFIKNAIPIPSGVTVDFEGTTIRVKGPSGEIVREFVDKRLEIKKENDTLVISRKNTNDDSTAIAGTYWRILDGMIKGAKDGISKVLDLVGVGYRAQLSGNNVQLQLGFSHPVIHPLPPGVSANLPTQTEIVLTGADKVLIGQVAADIRSYRPPEPYKGKGVRYRNEKVIIKETKKK